MTSPPLLTPIHSAALLRASMATLRSETEALGADAMRWHPAEGEWCTNEVIGHLIEAERRGFAGRILEILGDPGGELDTWDQEEVQRQRNDCARDGHALLEELSSMRDDGLRTLDDLRPNQLELSGEHVDVGTLRVSDLLHEWVYHDRAHVRQALENTQAHVWPHMGNAQRFSDLG